MRFLILNTDYPEALDWLYRAHPTLRRQNWDDQIQARSDSLIASADCFSRSLRNLGHAASDVYLNNGIAQRQWAREHGVAVRPSWELSFKRGWLPWLTRPPRWSWDPAIVRAQIQALDPDVVVNLAMDSVPADFFPTRRQRQWMLVGYGEPPVLLNPQKWSTYDLIVAPSELMVAYFRRMGLNAHLLRFAFDTAILDRQVMLSAADANEDDPPVRFIGSLGPAHSWRVKILEYLSRRLGARLGIWAPQVGGLHELSPIRDRYRGSAFGESFYRVLRGAKIVINAHIDIAGDHADNMRMFETTGIGRLLVTDSKVNLRAIFEPGREVVSYSAPEDCGDAIEHYLAHAGERNDIAIAGQQRTLREHTYGHRMRQLLDIVSGTVQYQC